MAVSRMARVSSWVGVALMIVAAASCSDDAGAEDGEADDCDSGHGPCDGTDAPPDAPVVECQGIDDCVTQSICWEACNCNDAPSEYEEVFTATACIDGQCVWERTQLSCPGPDCVSC